MMPVQVYLLLGSNQGDSLQILLQAQQHISRELGPIITASSCYKSAAWGKTDQPDFYNQVLHVETRLSPQQALSTLQTIERELGRIRVTKWGPRLIDIDILLWGDLILKTDHLIIPHPGIASRRFTLMPLAEIAPELIHPVTQKSIRKMLEECPDHLAVTRL